MQVITWNIQAGKGCDGKVDLERVVADCRQLADFDVLCLQEVSNNFPLLAGNSKINQFEMLARLLPGYTTYKGIALDVIAPDDGQRRQFGNMIISRLPVLQVFRHQLPCPADPGKLFMPRMLIEAILKTSFGPVRIMTSHLEYYSAKQRSAQIEAIRNLHAEASGHASDSVLDTSEGTFRSMARPASAILTADFNLQPSDPLHQRIQDPFNDSTLAFCDAWHALHPNETHPLTIGIYDRAQWPAPNTFDFIFVTEDLAPRIREVRVDALTKASDHQPVLLTLAED